MRSDKIILISIIAVCLVTLFVGSSAYGATDSPSVTVNSGSLSIASNAAVSMSSVTLDGTDKTSSGTMSTLTSTDARGLGTGWNVTLVSTNFVKTTDATKTIASTGFSIASPTVTTVDGNTAPTPSAVGNLGGSGGKLLSAASGNGMGKYTTTGALSLSVPAETYSGAYSATITATIADGP